MPCGAKPVATSGKNESADGAFTVNEFVEKFGVGKNLVYDEIAAGRLQARKVGLRKTIIPKDSARAWLHALPRLVLTRAESEALSA